MARSLRVICLGFLVAGTALNLPTAARSAWAGDLDKKDNVAGNEALGLYKEGRYEEAAKIFVKLSVAHPDLLVFVRNIGACYYYLRRIDPALSNLREYLLRKRDITADDRAEVEGWIAELEQLRRQAAAPPASPIAAQPSAPSAPPPAVVLLPQASQSPAAATTEPSRPAPSTTPVATSAPGIPTTPLPPSQPGDQPAGQHVSSPTNPMGQAGPQLATQYPPTETSSLPSQSRDTPAVAVGAEASVRTSDSNNNVVWVTGGVAVALLATGGVFTYLSQSAFSDTAKRYNPSRESTGKTYADVAGVSYGLGAASLVTTVIIAVATRSHHSAHSVALAPVLCPEALGAALYYTY
jgi:hypothetical protein